MARSNDHYTQRMLMDHLVQIGLGNLASDIIAAENRIEEVKTARNELVSAIWENNKDLIYPLLRPCHKKEFEKLKVRTNTW